MEVLLPVLRADFDLDWATYDGPAGEGAPAGATALDGAEVVVVPALAVGADGVRLGRGGGSYDRALARVPVGRPVIALLYDGELLPAVPAEDHDRRVGLVVQPCGVHRFEPRGGGTDGGIDEGADGGTA